MRSVDGKALIFVGRRPGERGYDTTSPPDPPLETGTQEGQVVNQDGNGPIGVTVSRLTPMPAVVKL